MFHFTKTSSPCFDDALVFKHLQKFLHYLSVFIAVAVRGACKCDGNRQGTNDFNLTTLTDITYTRNTTQGLTNQIREKKTKAQYCKR